MASRTRSSVASETTGSLPGRSQAMSSPDRSGMRRATAVAVCGRHRGTARRAARRAAPAAGDQAFAEGDVVRRADDPVHGRGRPLDDEPLVAASDGGQRCARPAVVREGLLGQPGRGRSVEQLSQRTVARASAGRGNVVRAVRSVVEVDDVRIRAVAGQDDDERLGRRRVRLDVDLAGRDVHEVAGRGVEGVLDAGRAEGVRRAPDRM